jgi:hypothetical protein
MKSRMPGAHSRLPMWIPIPTDSRYMIRYRYRLSLGSSRISDHLRISQSDAAITSMFVAYTSASSAFSQKLNENPAKRQAVIPAT